MSSVERWLAEVNHQGPIYVCAPGDPVPDSGVACLIVGGEGGPVYVPAGDAKGLVRLREVVNALLEPETGCPWDLKQTHATLVPYLIEEAYELQDAIETADEDSIIEELGDVLLQPLMHARIAEKAGRFSLETVANKIVEKLIRRHPHVFGDVKVADEAEVLKNWDAIKASEKAEKKSVVGGVPKSLPALHQALSISERAARSGFEWPDINGVFEKLDEEVCELKEAMKEQDIAEIEAELGDLLFTVVNIARWQKLDPEQALKKMLNRFIARFEAMEALAPKPLTQLSPEEWDQLWSQAKEPNSLGKA